jgi:hypothetical protein
MAFIMILLMLFMYIFAVAGTIVFDSYTKSKRTDLKYKDSFRYIKFHDQKRFWLRAKRGPK